ncbi:palmitoyl-(protein) hydrolase [Aureococcus anophagefferens]|nr:palmitoyl-(protein) hydrolase [Aureococcus anophagefferens]
MSGEAPNRSLPKTPERLLSLHKKYRKARASPDEDPPQPGAVDPPKPLSFPEAYERAEQAGAGENTPGGTFEPRSPRLGAAVARCRAAAAAPTPRPPRAAGGLLPERVLKSRESGEGIDVLVELGFRLNDPHASAASDYLAIVETWDSFGTVAFSGYVLSPKLGDAAPGGKKRGPRDKCVVCVGRDGVRVLSTDRLRTLGVLAARRIARWVPRPCTDGDGDDGKGASELVFEWAPPSEGDDAALRCVFRLQGRDAARDCCALLDDYGTLDAAPESNSELALPSAPPKPPADGEAPPPEAPPAPPADTARCAGTDEGADRDLERSSTPPPAERDGGDEASEKPTAPAAATELAGRPPQKSVGTYLNNLYDSLVFAIIRPPRSVYDERRLGPTSFAVAGRFHRRDVRLRNVRGESCAARTGCRRLYGDDGAKRAAA